MPWDRYQASPIGSSPGSERRPRVYTGGCSSSSSTSGSSPAARASRTRSWSANAVRYSTVASSEIHSSWTTRSPYSAAPAPFYAVAMESTWVTRLRWRMRGAWMWPTFAALTAFDALLLHARPIAGDDTSLLEGVLLAGFFNLVAIAVVAPMVGAVVRRRWRPDLPKAVAHDYAGTTLLPLVSLGLLAGGLAHDPA